MSKRRRRNCQEIINEYWPGAPFEPAIEPQQFSYDRLLTMVQSAHDLGAHSMSEVDGLLHTAVGYILSTNGFYPHYIDTCSGRQSVGLEAWGVREFNDKLRSSSVGRDDRTQYMQGIEKELAETRAALEAIAGIGCQSSDLCGSGDSAEPCASCVASQALKRTSR